MPRKCVISLTLLMFALGSCMTTYEPRPSPRLVTIMEAGNPLLVKNGRRYPIGLFGGDLEDAVAPNAAAMEHAQAFRNQTLGGFLLSMVAIVPMTAGLVMTMNGTDQRNASQALPNTLLIGGVVAYAVGLGMVLGAQPHMHDAINVYNDWIDAGMPADATLTE